MRSRINKASIASPLLLAALLLVASGGCTTHPTDTPPAGAATPPAKARASLTAAFALRDTVNAVVGFRDPMPARLDPPEMASHRQAARRIAEAIATAHAPGFRVTRFYDHVPAVAGRLSRAALDRLLQDPNVAYVQLDAEGGGALRVSVPAIGGDVAKTTFGVTGKGVRVAVLDTGANLGHPDLESSILPDQHCFTQSDCPPNHTTEGTSAQDDNGHGSNVTGIITSDGVLAGPGFAPDAQIISVKIDDAQDRGQTSDWVAGLDWVFTNLATLKVNIVNLSIVTDALYPSASECDAQQPALAAALKRLGDAGVTIFAASGNQGSATAMGSPACNTGVIAVGATYKSDQGRQPATNTFRAFFGTSFADCADATTAFDQITCFTNSNARLDMVAPGAVIISDILGTGIGGFQGTSQASPSAAGVAALMLQCDPNLTPTEIRDILRSTGVSVTDPKNGMSFPSIRAVPAVSAACGMADGGAPDAAPRDAAPDSGDAGGARGGAGGATGGAGGARGGAGGATGGAAGGTAGAAGGAAGAVGAAAGGAGGAAGAAGAAAGAAAGTAGGGPGAGGSAGATDGGAAGAVGADAATGGRDAGAADTGEVSGAGGRGGAAGTSGPGGSAAGGHSGGAGGAGGSPSSGGCSCSTASTTPRDLGFDLGLFGLAIVAPLARRRQARRALDNDGGRGS